MGNILRRFKPEDAAGVKDLILRILSKEYPFDRSVYSDSDLDRIAETYGGKREAFFVIDEDGVIAGTVGVKEDAKDEALVRRLFVDADHRHRGYGRELLEKAIEFCREHGYKAAYFRCTDRMGEAMRLCMKKGFSAKETLEVSGFKIHRLELKIQ
jgi:GNAT superfamily N-acetyltransferase